MISKVILSIIMIINVSFMIKETLLGQSVPGQINYGKNEYIEYHIGDMPLVISVPHGGTLEPPLMEKRSCGSNAYDVSTRELSKYLSDSIYSLTKKYPHLIISNLRRNRLDANREEFEATCGEDWTLTFYNEYHNFIKQALQTVKSNFSFGLFIDLHGHNHKEEKIEIGYLLDNVELANLEMNDSIFATKSGVGSLAIRNGKSLTELIYGKNSLGVLLEKNGYPAMPGSEISEPGELPYFPGGYNTQTYFSKDSNVISALQIELNKKSIRDNERNIKRFAGVLARVLLQYMSEYNLK